MHLLRNDENNKLHYQVLITLSITMELRLLHYMFTKIIELNIFKYQTKHI